MEELLQAINPWWKEKGISKELARPVKREVFAELQKLFPYRQATIITGLRRVGKSTLLYQLLETVLTEGPPEQALYFSFDLQVEDIHTLLQAYEKVTGWNWKKEKTFIFFDEIQKLPNWPSQLKLLYDSFPHLKFVVSGSSSVALEKEAVSTLTGRYFLVSVSPLSFKEFLTLKKSTIDLKKERLWADEIIREFKDYLKKPFPEIIQWKDDVLIKQYLQESVIDKVVRRDLPDQFKGTRQELLLKLLHIFYASPGMYLNYDHLASDLKVNKRSLIQHVFYLEFAYLIRRVRNYRSNFLTASKKLQRIYSYHWGLLFALGNAPIAESFVASMLDAKYYWRDGKKEIDFLIPGKKVLPIEVKEGTSEKEEDLQHLLYYCKKNNIKRALLIYSGEEKIEQMAGVEIYKMPFWKVTRESIEGL